MPSAFSTFGEHKEMFIKKKNYANYHNGRQGIRKRSFDKQ